MGAVDTYFIGFRKGSFAASRARPQNLDVPFPRKSLNGGVISPANDPILYLVEKTSCRAVMLCYVVRRSYEEKGKYTIL